VYDALKLWRALLSLYNFCYHFYIDRPETTEPVSIKLYYYYLADDQRCQCSVSDDSREMIIDVNLCMLIAYRIL